MNELFDDTFMLLGQHIGDMLYLLLEKVTSERKDERLDLFDSLVTR